MINLFAQQSPPVRERVSDLALDVDNVENEPHQGDEEHKADDAGCNNALDACRRETSAVCMCRFKRLHQSKMKGICLTSA